MFLDQVMQMFERQPENFITSLMNNDLCNLASSRRNISDDISDLSDYAICNCYKRKYFCLSVKFSYYK